MFYWNKYRRQFAWKDEGAGGANNSAAKRRDDPSQAPGEWIATLWLSLFSLSLPLFFCLYLVWLFCNDNTLAKKRESDNTDVIVTEAKEKLSIAMQLWRKNFKSNIKRKNLHFYFCKSVWQNHKGLEFSVRAKQASCNDHIFCWCF